MRRKARNVNLTGTSPKHLFAIAKQAFLTEECASVKHGGANIGTPSPGLTFPESPSFGSPCLGTSSRGPDPYPGPDPPDHLRRLLAIVDSTLNQLCALPLDDEWSSVKTSCDFINSSVGSDHVDSSLTDNFSIPVDVIGTNASHVTQWNFFQESMNDIVTSGTQDDLISFECLSAPSLTLRSETPVPQRCLLCDDYEWSPVDRPLDVIEPKKRAVTFVETDSKGVCTEEPLPEPDKTLEDIDEVVHAILSSLSSSKESQVERKKKRGDSGTETLLNAKKIPPKSKKNKPETVPYKTRAAAVRTPSKLNAKKSKSPSPSCLVKPSPTTSSTFRESSISTRTRASCASAPSQRGTRRVGDACLLKDAAPPRPRVSPPFPRKAPRKAGAGSSLVMEPLMTVVRQIASSRNASAGDGEAVLLFTGNKVNACAESGDVDSSSVVCIQLASKETQRISAMVSTLLAGNDCVDVGTMTDEMHTSISPGKNASVRDLDVGAGNCVLVIRPRLRHRRFATSAASAIVRPGRTRRKTAAMMSSQSYGTAQRLRRHVRRRRNRRRRSQALQTHPALRRNPLLTLCLSMMSLMFDSLSVNILCNPQ